MQRRAAWQTAIIVIAVLAVGYTARLGRVFLIPVVIAVLFNFLLSPVIRALGRARVPRPAAAAIVVLVLVTVVAGLAYAVAEPAEQWVARAPTALDSAATRLRSLRRTVRQVQQEASQIEKAAGVMPTPAAPSGGGSMAQRLAGVTVALAAGIVEVVLLSYFLLASGDLYLRKLVSVLPQVDDAESGMRVARAIEGSLSRYLLTQTALNVCLGAAVTIALWLLGMPTPWLWGVLACLLAFIPYVGSLTLLFLLTIVALTAMDNPARAVTVPLTYFLINFLSANVVAPYVLGRRLTLHPVIILASLAFWASMWGLPGAFLSLPLLAAAKIICDEVPALRAVGEVLGGREARGRGR